MSSLTRCLLTRSRPALGERLGVLDQTRRRSATGSLHREFALTRFEIARTFGRAHRFRLVVSHEALNRRARMFDTRRPRSSACVAIPTHGQTCPCFIQDRWQKTERTGMMTSQHLPAARNHDCCGDDDPHPRDHHAQSHGCDDDKHPSKSTPHSHPLLTSISARSMPGPSRRFLAARAPALALSCSLVAIRAHLLFIADLTTAGVVPPKFIQL